MRARRIGVLAAVAASCALPFVDCRSATFINLTIQSDGCDRLKGLSVVVDTPERYEQRDTPVATKNACDKAPLVGTLTIAPSAEKDAAVGIKVIAAVDTTQIDQCTAANDYRGCIVARRIVSFTPHAAQNVDVFISLACLDQTCDPGSTCENGLCKPIPGAVPPEGDGAPPPPLDSGPRDSGGDGGPPVDASVGCNPAACSGSTIKSGQSAACDPDGYCAVTCGTGGAKCDGPTCPPGVDCRIRCNSGGECGKVQCDSPGRCLVECESNGACGGDVKCTAAECNVHCEVNGACKTLTVNANRTTITCKGDNNTCATTRVDAGSTLISCGAADTCQDTVVSGGSAQLDCSGQGGTCPGTQVCCAGSCSGPFDVKNPATCPP
jgi:hypothetical protein